MNTPMQSRISEMNAMADFIAASRERDTEPSDESILRIVEKMPRDFDWLTDGQVIDFARAVLALRDSK